MVAPESTSGSLLSSDRAPFGVSDGSARLITDDVDPEVLKALSTPADAD